MFPRFVIAAVAAVAVTAAAGAAEAAVTVYNNAGAFGDALSGVTTFGFSGIGEADWYSTYPAGLTVGPATFSAPDRIPGNAGTKGTLFLFGDQYRGNPYGTTAALSSQGLGGAKAILDVDLTSPVYAIGFDVGSYTTLNAATSIFINGVDVSDLVLPAGTGAPYPTEFVGFVSSAPITSVVFSNASAPAIDLTDFKIGAMAPVPEPSAWALLTLGIGLMGGALRVSRCPG